MAGQHRRKFVWPSFFSDSSTFLFQRVFFFFSFFFLFSLLFLFFLFSRSARTGFSRAIFLSFSPRTVYHIFSSSRDVAQRSLHRYNVYTNNGEEEEEGRGRRKRSWRRFLFFLFFYITALLFGREENGRTISGVGKKGGGKEEGERWSVDVEARVSKTL